MNTVDCDTKAEAWDAHTARVKRAEKIYESIAAEISIHASDSVLDFGCGTGLLGFHFINAVTRVTFADTSVGMLEQVRKKAELLPKGKADTLNLTEQALRNTYSIIVSLLALHHVENVEATLCRLSELVAQDGYICLSDLDLEDGSFHYPDVAPHNGIDREEVLRNLRKNGIRILCNKTVFIEEKVVNGEHKTYPIFLIAGQKQSTYSPHE